MHAKHTISLILFEATTKIVQSTFGSVHIVEFAGQSKVFLDPLNTSALLVNKASTVQASQLGTKRL